MTEALTLQKPSVAGRESGGPTASAIPDASYKIEIDNLYKTYKSRTGPVFALDNVSLKI